MEPPAVAPIEAWPGLVARPARGRGDWPAGIRVVLVHGAMDRGAGMAHVARRLRDASTLRYDRRGYGRAVELGPGSLVDHVDDLISIAGHDPVVLFGHSFGGLVVLGAAASGRLDIRGLVTWEVPTPWIEGWTGWGVDDPGDETDRPAAIAETFMRRAVGAARYDALPEATRAARRREGPALIADMDPNLAAGVPFDPSRVSCRCLFGAGDRSPVPYVNGAAWLASRVPEAASRVLEGAAHDAPMTQASDLAAMIREVAGRSVGDSSIGGTGGRDASVV